MVSLTPKISNIFKQVKTIGLQLALPSNHYTWNYSSLKMLDYIF